MSILILMSSSMVMATMFMFHKHPMSMGTTLLMQTLLMMMLTGVFFENFWYSYIFFLVMVGGMLIIFIYMTSIASNEKFKFSSTMMIMMTITGMTMTLIMMNEPFIQSMMTNPQDMMSMEMNKMWEMSMIKFFLDPGKKMFIMIMIFLLMALIAVVKITSMTSGALRQKSYEKTN
uniref:NADH-ubiquinone oxidoreductase chain 6 n=1 Tax=Attagenus unicolor japonicus TaxID=1531404 RepID=A0A7S6UAY5_9COLE|nr:NADH dehydrogenase subunit 6 [Attagenus unicolor japonicus]